MADEVKIMGSPEWRLKNKIGFFLGPALFIIALLIPMGMPDTAHKCLAAAIWIATWWITEAIPIAATSLLPLVLIPTLGINSATATAAPYANKSVILFMGGFMIAQSIIKWNLHHRLSLLIVNAIGVSPKKIILGFMVSSAVMSMWISNTATVLALMPIGLAVVYLVADDIKRQKMDIPIAKGEFNFGIALMLGIAFAATIGGIGTPIGTPPNIIFIGALEELYPGPSVSFIKWMLFGLPIVIIFIPIAWLILITIYKPRFKEVPGGKELIRSEIKKLGPWSKGEKASMAIFALTALMWVLRPILINPYISEMIDDSTIAIAGAVLLFMVPVSWEKGEFSIDWEWASRIPWGILLLFGGGLSLAQAINVSGLAIWLGNGLENFSSLPAILIIFIVAVFTATLSEMTSNTAATAMMMPIMAALATAMGTSPIAPMLAAALSASFVYLLPVGTPPNAVVYGSGYLRVIDMIKGGIWIKIIHIAIGSLLIYYLAIPLFMSSIG